MARGAHAAQAGLGLRPSLLVSEERESPACAHGRGERPPRDQRGAREGLAVGARLSRAGGVHRPPRQGRHDSRARRGLRRGGVPPPHLTRSGPASPHARRGRQHDENRRRRVAGARRRGDPQDIPARRRLPVRDPPPPRAHSPAQRRVDRAHQGDGRTPGRPGGDDPRLLDTTAIAGRAHGGARYRGLHRLSGRCSRNPGGEGAGRPSAAA
jgi:hypothetical protein